MPLPENLLNPIPGDNPSGTDLRYDPIYEKIKEARREEEEIEQGAWQHEVKKAEWSTVTKVATETLATKTKDLQIAAWLTEALLKTEGFGGLAQGLTLSKDLIEKFWDTVYPELEDGDAELRATPLEWIGSSLAMPVRMVPLNREGHDWLDYTGSRKIGYEDPSASSEKKAAREKLLKEGKVAPEAFDKSFVETPKVFYSKGEKDLDASAATLEALDKLCREKFGDVAPNFGDLKKALQEVRHTVHQLLDKKRETEPDPVEAPPAEEEAQSEAGEGQAVGGGMSRAAGPAGIVIPFADHEPADRREAIMSVARAAAVLRKQEPFSPAPYLMMRGLRWGELRAAFRSSDPAKLEGPPTELRQHIKRLALEKKWNEVLETAENAMSLPCSRAWLDLQRFVIEACVGLGGDYDVIAVAIRSELKGLLRDLPQLLQTNLLDDTPAANSETQAWVQELLSETPAQAAEAAAPPPAPEAPVVEDHSSPGWQKKFVDSYALAQEALKGGQPEKAIDIMSREVERQLSGRGKFLRKMQLVEVCVSASKPNIAQPMIEELAAAVENYKLELWEDREVVCKALALILKNSERIKKDAAESKKIFDRICRLDPVQALSCL